MKLWIDVHNAAGERLGSGPIRHVVSASITRVLDGVGSIGFAVPGTDERAVRLIDNKRRVRLFTTRNGVVHELGRGIIENVSAKDSPSGWSLNADCPDNLAELKYRSIWLGRKYSGQRVDAIVDSLLALTSGWTRSGSDATLVNARFDGTSILGAAQALVQQQGIHLRESSPGVLEIGAFGESNGLRVINRTRPNRIVNNKVLLIESLTQIDNSEDIVNRLVPLGGGRGDTALSLALSNRVGAYQILQMAGPDGRALYYLEDQASITLNGPIEKVGTFKTIVPITNALEDQIAAANALYDMAAAWLARYAIKYRSYGFTLRDVQANLLPGDKIRVRYIGRINDSKGNMVDYRSIDEEMWVLEVRERYNANGISTTVKVATIDRYDLDTDEVILGGLEAIHINNVAVDSYPTKAPYVYTRTLDSTHSAIVPLEFDNSTARLVRCNMRLLTRPFRATSKGAAAGGGSTSGGGGDHNHVVMQMTLGGTGGKTLREVSFAYGSVSSPSIGFVDLPLDITPTGSLPHDYIVTATASGNHTHTTPAHTHPPDYGIEDDVQRPDTVRITIDGVDYTSALGGPWGVGGVAVNTQLEISAQLKASGNLQSRHTITITCDSGQGEVEVTLIPVEVIQSIEVFE
jgi:hypothetical protein